MAHFTCLAMEMRGRKPKMTVACGAARSRSRRGKEMSPVCMLSPLRPFVTALQDKRPTIRLPLRPCLSLSLPAGCWHTLALSWPHRSTARARWRACRSTWPTPSAPPSSPRPSSSPASQSCRRAPSRRRSRSRASRSPHRACCKGCGLERRACWRATLAGAVAALAPCGWQSRLARRATCSIA